MKLGYTDFIDKHKKKAIIVFAVSTLIIFVAPILYFRQTFQYPQMAMTTSFYVIGVDIILFPVSSKQDYLYLLQELPYIAPASFSEYFKPYSSHYAMMCIGSLIFCFTIISLIIILAQTFRQKRISKPLLYLPLAFYIVYVFVMSIIDKGVPFIGFYLAIILEVLVILYCAGFQHFPHRSHSQHKPTDKERIAELEQQVAELQKEKDVD